jgi:murein L,D-transpeptidase YcbB/YkuD
LGDRIALVTTRPIVSRFRRCALSFASSFGLAALGAVVPWTLAHATGRAREPQVASAPRGSGTDSVSISAVIARALGDARPPHLRNDEWLTVRRLYRGENTSAAVAPLWLDGDRLASRATELAVLLDSVETIGLEPNDYAVADVAAALRSVTATRGGAAAAEALARADLLLTSSFVALVDDLLTGRVDPREVEPAWHIAPRAFDVGARIAAALDTVRGGRPIRDVLAALRPDYGAYGALVRALARYRALESAGGWPRLPNGPVLRAGQAGPAVPVLRQRLAAEGYARSATGSDTLDTVLVGVVAAFQLRHGLPVDSVIGPRTRAALNVPASRRVRQIEANIERMRWLPPNPGERFVVVNIPSFVLYAFDGGRRVLNMRVVVGDELASRRTPVFADTMEYIEFGPYWNVPRSIAVNEILPAARRDRGYLVRNNYQILRGWGDDAPVVDPRSLSDAALFSTRYRVRQLPGPDNALGRVKFMFPNDYAVYLHDTPSRSRFEDADRAVSHGCVRVADPQALAEFVLQGNTAWPREQIAMALASGRHLRVNLRHGPPVYLIYLTAFGRDGDVMFRDDIYDRDDRLLRALAAR